MVNHEWFHLVCALTLFSPSYKPGAFDWEDVLADIYPSSVEELNYKTMFVSIVMGHSYNGRNPTTNSTSF